MFIVSEDAPYWLAALRLPGVGPITFRRWLTLFSDIKKIFSASIAELHEAGFKQEEVTLLKAVDWKRVEKDMQWLQKSNCHFISCIDPHHPSLLQQIYAAPLALFVKGDLQLLKRPQIAIVGSRTPTATGVETAMQFAKQLSVNGLVITSGLAFGIDAAAHKGALLEGQTIAVMGTGFNHIYPSVHRRLAEQIIEKGALISEFLPDQLPKPKNFPLRNRVISGLSLGVLVIEAALRSGSLITARDALEQGREVFAVPGSIHNPLARGCHYLLRQGAKLVETVNDIFEELPGFDKTNKDRAKFEHPAFEKIDLAENQRKIYSQIGDEITSIDTIIVRSGLTASEVSSILLSLELKGCVRTVSGGYVRTLI